MLRKKKTELSLPFRGVYSLLHDYLFHNWWLFLSLSFLFLLYGLASRKEEAKWQKYTQVLLELEQKYIQEKEREKTLLWEIQVCKEDSWKELILMSELGVIPQNYEKMLFVPMKDKS